LDRLPLGGPPHHGDKIYIDWLRAITIPAGFRAVCQQTFHAQEQKVKCSADVTIAIENPKTQRFDRAGWFSSSTGFPCFRSDFLPILSHPMARPQNHADRARGISSQLSEGV
jgi:hypothetical protein